jgi:putative spermidine/putrescine transport system ATP-binding protein
MQGPGGISVGVDGSELRILAVSKRYGNVEALVDASLDVRKGECVTLLGPSGSGKTTLLNLVAGLITPDSGDIHISGRQATHLPPHQRDIGVVFQNYALFPHLTVFENIAFPLRMRRLRGVDIQAKVGKVLEAVALSDKAERMPGQLSGGQQQRIALARAMVYEPSVILMDEPLAALDKKLREKLQLEIRRFQREFGITMLYVTHDQDEALLLSDRICLMNNARIEQIGTPDDLYFRPRSLFAADFIGESNVFTARVRSAVDGCLVVEGPGASALRIRCDASVVAGETVTLVVRPERIRIGAPGPGSDSVNRVQARVEEIAFQGDRIRYYARADAASLFSVKVLTGASSARASAGDAVSLEFDADSVIVLPKDSALKSMSSDRTPSREDVDSPLSLIPGEGRREAALGRS